jgi:NADPH oxidase
MEKGYDRSSVGSLKVSERARWPPLTRMLMSGEMSGERPKDLNARERFDRWMVNEGYRRLWVLSKHPRGQQC